MQVAAPSAGEGATTPQQQQQQQQLQLQNFQYGGVPITADHLRKLLGEQYSCTTAFSDRLAHGPNTRPRLPQLECTLYDKRVTPKSQIQS